MAVTVMTKKRGRPLVTGEVGVSIINWKNKHSSGGGEILTNRKCSRKKKDIRDSVRMGVPCQREKSQVERHHREVAADVSHRKHPNFPQR